jgi:hypothetical protein
MESLLAAMESLTASFSAFKCRMHMMGGGEGIEDGKE